MNLKFEETRLMPLLISIQEIIRLIGVWFGMDRRLGLHQVAVGSLIVPISKGKMIKYKVRHRQRF